MEGYPEQIEEFIASKQYAVLRDLFLPLEPADIAWLLEECGEVGRFRTYDFPFDGYYPELTYKSVVADPATRFYGFIFFCFLLFLRMRLMCRSKSPVEIRSASKYCSKAGTVQE